MTEAPWPRRTWALALLGAATGFLVNRILPAPVYYDSGRISSVEALVPTAAELALATFLIVAALGFAYVVERRRLLGSILFGLGAGLVTASVVQQADQSRQTSEDWRLVCAAVAVAIAAPLFQAWRDRPAGRRLPAYVDAHDHAWNNLVLWCASFVFLGIVWLLAWLLGALFDLIGIDILKKLLEKRSFGFVLSGAALGAGIGLIRDRRALLGTLRQVITTVLSVLAPVLALGLLLFLVALPFTGLAPLWGATRSTTPILLAVITGALVLINAIIGDSDAELSQSRLLRLAAILLSAVLLPLAAIAALSVNLRIVQHGLTPDRLWAVTFVAIASAFAIAAIFALLRRLPRLDGWTDRIRGGNLILAIALCAGLIVLSTPLVDFGAIATRNQMGRLSRGEVSPQDFDWVAMRFEFGPAGVAALEALKTGTVAPAQAKMALASDSRWELARKSSVQRRRAKGEEVIVTLPRGAAVPKALLDAIDEETGCDPSDTCVIVLESADAALVFSVNPKASFAAATARHYARQAGVWSSENPLASRRDDDKLTQSEVAIDEALKSGNVTVRTIERRQLFVGDQPVSAPFK